MAFEDLNPAVRVEEILDGADIEPATRLEYFMKKAANSGGVDVIEMPQAMESELRGIIENAGMAAAASGNDFGTNTVSSATSSFKSALFDAVKNYATLGKMFCLRAGTDIGPAWVPDYAVWNDTSPMHCEITIRWNVQLVSNMCFITYVTLRLEGGAAGTLSADHLVVKY